jgi:hypothetical protein
MTEVEFLDLWKKIHATFGLDGTAPGRLESFNSCLDRVRAMSADSRNYILHSFQNLDRLPLNIGKTAQEYYRLWQADKINYLEKNKPVFLKSDCPHCINGYIYASKDNNCGQKCVYTFACGHCGKGSAGFITATREKILAIGYEIEMPVSVAQ